MLPAPLSCRSIDISHKYLICHFMHHFSRHQHHSLARVFAISEQMAYDLMGSSKNAYEILSDLDEEALLNFLIRNKLVNMTRNLYQKRKYVSYFCGDMDTAAKTYELLEELNEKGAVQASTGEFDLCLGV